MSQFEGVPLRGAASKGSRRKSKLAACNILAIS